MIWQFWYIFGAKIQIIRKALQIKMSDDDLMNIWWSYDENMNIYKQTMNFCASKQTCDKTN